MVINKIIFALIFVIGLTLSCQNVSAQNAKKKPKPVSKAEMEKREVEKFVASFIHVFEKTKDLDQIPTKFFVADFKQLIIKNKEWNLGNDEIEIQLTDAEQYEFKSLLLNLVYMSLMWDAGNHEKSMLDIDNDSDDDDDKTLEKMFPPQVVELVKENKAFRNLMDLDNGSDYKIKGVKEYNDLIIDLRKITNLQRNFLNKQSPAWKKNFAKNIKKVRKQFKYGESVSELCAEDECKGLPEKTRIFTVSAFPFFLQIIKENNEFKVINIFPYSHLIKY